MADVANSKLLQQIEGIQHVKDAFVVLIKTEWNAAIVDELERGCISILQKHGIAFKTLTVPGAVELPFAVQYYWQAAPIKPSAFITLGCVIRGDTPHFDYVCQSVTQGVTSLNVTLPVPTIFGVLTVNTTEQAHERMGGIHGHKGEEAAITALKMMLLQQQITNG
jgi:6,7-dimethyl-8-ribityllumazine synthase